MKTKWLLLMVAVVVGLGCAERSVVYSYVTFTNTVDEVREVVVTNYTDEVMVVWVTNAVYERMEVPVTVTVTVTNYVQEPVTGYGDARVPVKKTPKELQGLRGPRPYSDGATVNKSRRGR